MPTMDRVRWAVLGPGRIADNLVPDFRFVPKAELVAVGSRSVDRARAFADKHGIERAHGSYRELLDDPAIDAVYIATPHPQHHAIGVAALQAGKAILVEKAFTATAAGAEDLVNTAQRLGVFAMEAMWTRFQPAIVRLRDLLADGAIGEVQSVQVDLGVVRDFDPADRVFAHQLGGGALLDLGVYLVNFAHMVLGEPLAVHAAGSLEPSGVDAAASLLLSYPDGRTASLMCGLHTPMPGHARVFGTAGWIDVQPRFHHPRSLVLHQQGHEPESMIIPPIGDGYAHELIEVTECLRTGRTESMVMPLAASLSVQRSPDSALAQLGVRFSEDQNAL